MIVPLKQIAIISTDNVVRLSNINSGVDGASDFGYSISENESSIRDNQPNLISNTHQLDIRTLEDDGSQEHLDNWTRDNSEVYISGITLDGFFLWGDKETATGATRLYKNYQFDGRRSNKIFARSDELPGFDSETGIFNGGIWVGDNGLGGYEWADTDGNNEPDGWTSNQFSNESFSNGQFSFDTTTSLQSATREVYFPFEGEQITFSINIDALSGSYSTSEIEIRFFDASDSILGSATESFSSTGRVSVSSNVLADTVYIRCIFRYETSSGTGSSTVSDPMLALGTGTAYTKY